MAKLNDTQLIFLSVAAARADGAATFPNDMPNAAARRVGAKLVRLGLMGEVEAKAGMPIWREDGDVRLSLVMTDAGREAIGVLADPEAAGGIAPDYSEVAAADASSAQHVSRSRNSFHRHAPTRAPGLPEKTQRRGQAASPKPNDVAREHRVTSPLRSGSKQTLLIKLLSRKSGACMSEIVSAIGWLPHSTRAALTGLRKKGMQVERFRKADGSSVYRLIAVPTAGA